MDNYDVIYEGEFPVDSVERTDEEIKRLIIEQAKRSGVEINDEDNIEVIRGAGVGNYDGVSETFIEPVTIVRKPKVIYEGEFPVDSVERTDEEIKRLIIEQAKRSGVEINDENNIEVIRGAGVGNYDGVSETFIEPVAIVEKSAKKKADSTVKETKEEDDTQERIAALKAEIARLEAEKARREQESKGIKQEKEPEKEKQLEEIEKEMEKIQNQLKQYAAIHDGLLKKLEEVFEKRFAHLSKPGLITAEDMENFNKYEDIFNKLLDEIKKTRKSSEYLIKKREFLENKKNELLNIESKDKKPEINAQDIIDVMKEKELKKKIIRAKGLQEIYDKKVVDRTPEEMQTIKTELNNAYNEIADYKSKHPEVSVSDIIEILYNLEDSMELRAEPVKIGLLEEEVENIEQNASKLPVKVNTQVVPTDYEPAPAPEDMKDVEPKRGMDEKIVILVDEDGNKYIRSSNPQRYGIKELGEEITVDGASYVQISEEDAEYIVENASNDIDPYKVEFLNIEENEMEEELDVDEIVNKLTDGINVNYQEYECYTASNINISEEFKNELKAEDGRYNIIHILPATVKVVTNCIKKLYNKFILHDDTIDEMEIFNARLDSLTEEELEILARGYTEDKEIENDFLNDQIIKKIEMYEASKHSEEEIKEMFEDVEESEEVNEKKEEEVNEMDAFLQEHFDNVRISRPEEVGRTR